MSSQNLLWNMVFIVDISGMEGEVGLVAGRSQREKRRSYKDLLREEEEIAAQVRKTSKKHHKVTAGSYGNIQHQVASDQQMLDELLSSIDLSVYMFYNCCVIRNTCNNLKSCL